MKIALICEHGGHLTELLFLLDAFGGHDIIFITNKSPRTFSLPFKRYLLDPIRASPKTLLSNSILFYKIFLREHVDLAISTGAEIAIPAFLVAKFLGVKTIFIESWCRVETRSKTGRFLYLFSNFFIVQWPQIVKKYGDKAIYVGSILQ